MKQIAVDSSMKKLSTEALTGADPGVEEGGSTKMSAREARAQNLATPLNR